MLDEITAARNGRRGYDPGEIRAAALIIRGDGIVSAPTPTPNGGSMR